MSPRKSAALVAATWLASAGCARVLGIEELPVYPSEAGVDGGTDTETPDRADDEATTACPGPLPPTIAFSGYSVSSWEIDLAFTPGPLYSLKRVATHAADGPPSYWTNLASMLCAGSFQDQGQSLGPDALPDGGLNQNWQYTYELSVILPDGGTDPRVCPLDLTIQTWPSPSQAGPADQDGSTVESLPIADACSTEQ
jgi:hypothetical protein